MVESTVTGVFDGIAAAVLLMVLGLALLFATLITITRNMIAGTAERALNAVLGRSGSLGLLVGWCSRRGAVIEHHDVAVDPDAGDRRADAAQRVPGDPWRQRRHHHHALIAARAVPQIKGLQIALVHLLFNVTAIMVFFPIPAMRRIPIEGRDGWPAWPHGAGRPCSFTSSGCSSCCR